MLLSRACVTALPLLLATSAYAQWPLYAPSPIGLSTPVHTHPDGHRSLSITSTAPDGATCGNQSRFSAGSELAVGSSAFVYIPGVLPSTGGGTTHRIGFYSAEYADAATGEAYSVASNITDGRTVGGKSTMLDGAVHAWAWTESAGEVRIGLQGADHTSPAGKQYSSVIGAANTANVLFGSSSRFGGTGQGETRRATNQSLFAWTAQGGTERMGFFGNAYTESDGEQNTYSSPPPFADNWSDNGYFVGVSNRFDATPGSDGWVWHRTTGTVRCGLRGVGYTSSNSGFTVVPQVVSNTGVVAGYSSAYDPVTFSFRGYQSWAWNPTTGAVPIGLTGPEYLSSNGLLESDIRGIGPGGQVIGRSRNGQTGVNDGMDAWFWNAAAGTQRIGLYGPDFTGNNNGGDGYENAAIQVYATGLVAGYAKDKLFDIDPPIVVAWLFTPGAGANPGTTVEVIPPGAQFRSTSGRRWSTISDINPTTGRVLGYAKFYDGEIERGYKAFTFNPSNGNYFVFSVDANANGDSTTIPLRIFDDHTVLGNFLDYNEEDDAAPPVASGFIWRAGQGTADLLSRIDTGDGGLTGLGLEGPASCVGYSRLTSYEAFLSYVRRSGFPNGYNNAFVLLRSLPCGTSPDLFTLKDLYAAARQPVMTAPQGADQALVHSVAQTGVTPMRGVRLGGAGAPFTNPVIWGATGVSTNIPAVGPTVSPGDSIPLPTAPRAASLSGVLIQPGAGGGAGIDAAVSTYKPGQAGVLSAVSLDAEVLGSASDGVRISLVRIDNGNVPTTIIAQQPVAYSASGHTSLALSGGVLPLALAVDDRLVLTVDRGGVASTATQDYTVVDLRFGIVGPPLIISQPVMSPDACIDQDLSISVAATSAAAYQWRKDGVDLTDGPTGHSSRIAGATTATLTVRSSSPEDAGEYTCLVSNTCGSALSMTSTLTVETCACGPADIGQAGGIGGFDGQLDNNDFIVFITLFFVQAPAADRGVQGGFPGIDGQFDNNDFIVFINQFFEGC